MLTNIGTENIIIVYKNRLNGIKIFMPIVIQANDNR
jgi:hypothetical protein